MMKLTANFVTFALQNALMDLSLPHILHVSIPSKDWLMYASQRKQHCPSDRYFLTAQTSVFDEKVNSLFPTCSMLQSNML